jgi:hypothetical protein
MRKLEYHYLVTFTAPRMTPQKTKVCFTGEDRVCGATPFGAGAVVDSVREKRSI